MNTSAAWLSLITALLAGLAKDNGGAFSTFYVLLMAGCVLLAASATGIISSLGYWKYYEDTDIFARECRERLIEASLLKSLTKATKQKLRDDHPVLSRVSYNAQHLVWFGVQAIFAAIGLGFLIAAAQTI